MKRILLIAFTLLLLSVTYVADPLPSEASAILSEPKASICADSAALAASSEIEVLLRADSKALTSSSESEWAIRVNHETLAFASKSEGSGRGGDGMAGLSDEVATVDDRSGDMGSAELTLAVAARMEETAALLGLDGSVLVDEDVYADIVPLDGALFAASVDGELYALMDATGALLTEAVYDELRLTEGTLMAHRDGGWGLLSRDGDALSSFDFEAILPTGAGNCWALRPGEDDLALVLLDEFGRARFTSLRVRRWGEAGDGMLALQFEGGLWGYCDAGGSLAISARYDWAGRFVAGCAPVVAEGGWGAINKAGEWLVNPNHARLEVSPADFLLVSDNSDSPSAPTQRDADGDAISAMNQNAGEASGIAEQGAGSGASCVSVLDMRGELRARYVGVGVWAALVGEGYVVCDGEALRLFSSDGTLLESLARDAAVSEGLAGQFVLSEGMWGENCVRLSGTQARYQDLYPLGMVGDQPVYACLQVRSARYENDLLHEVQLSVDMDSARYGMVNTSGEMMLSCDFAWLGSLADDRFLARTETQWLMIDSSGKVYWRSRTALPLATPSF